MVPSENKTATVLSSVVNGKHSNILTNFLQTQLSMFKLIPFCKLDSKLLFASVSIFASPQKIKSDEVRLKTFGDTNKY